VTSGYSHRHGNGDYYYGTPSVDYRYYAPYGSYYGGAYGYYGQPYGYRYGQPYGYYGQPYGYRYGQPYGYYGQPYGYRYGSPHGYQPYYYGRRYPHYYYGQPRVHDPRPVQRRQVDPTPDGDVSPWRDLERLRARGRGGRVVPEVMTQPTMPQVDPDLSSGRDTQRRRRVPIDAAGPMPQPRRRFSPPQPPSAPAQGSEDSALDGSARGSRKSDPGTETAP
jgi:hypothetical protein